MTEINRRTVLRGVAVTGALGAVSPLLAGCGSDETTSGGGSSDATASGDAGSTPSGEGGGDGGATLAATSDIPVGGGKVFADQQVVVTQPSAGAFLAFTAVCTHQGCTVNSVQDGTINCPCHGSMFSIEDGSVAGGPAQAPLEEKSISVEGESITLT